MIDSDLLTKASPPRFSFGKVTRYFAENRQGSINQLVKFSAVGVLNTIIGYGAFFIFLNYTSYLIALAFATVIGVTNSYVWNHNWVFQHRRSILEFIKFNFVYIVAFLFNAGALLLCVEFLKLDPRLAQLALIPLVTIISFTGHKYWSFGNKRYRSDFTRSR
jgi:putative flippase GtrA